MTVPTTWTITHSCGHTTDRDLSDRPADRRAGFADWLTRSPCTDCWHATRTTDTASKDAWLAEQRATEQAEADTWAEHHHMPPLDGTERAVPWAVRCRHQLLTAAYTTLVVEGGLTEEEWELLEDDARLVTRAGWWLDHRNTDPGDLPELLRAATSDDRLTENPFV
ncbi:hypothetical protein [Streptomyces acidiscabies]|uniref:Uncharacterized protein n=3 Tax=Streptomyces acidiscabies TaxID=42234 RepID=A0ABU4MG13_9ACTN|nr:hypothetical protein [Streptomyces acidiscabies]MBP5936700.1 hypothetical protein [Streptomyces sp. LBUM 1476]MBZ3915302.1 hypothetical protein [Streptomyces acidiscabies]MDX3026055.1 hypothetical protein [Streptomyces acidiscabies]MDX3797030.1 hypothetical protein [Streptomyces acidiscabies]GAQ58952.1 hypothetical protein a10_08852 [Streptomyces acidiscabies]